MKLLQRSLCKKILFIVIFMTILSRIENTTTVHRKFEYKYSFKPPYLAQKDGSVPFWEYGGNAIASAENVRIAPSLRSQKGGIWTKNPLNFDWWEIDVAFRVTGRGRIGADGLAFWYTAQKGDYNGEVFGSSDKWNGLGIFFDSFDNDNKHNNPYIMAVLNDGTQLFDHQNDGATQLTAGCLRDFRNKPFPTRARIEYYQNTLTLLFNNGMTNNEQDYEMCFRIENVFLPKSGYFGVTAATGGLADDHDVIHFLTTSLHATQQADATNIGAEEQQKLKQEYQEYQKKLQQQKDDYRKDHPDEQKEPNIDDWFETDSQRELRQIFQGQSQIFEVIKQFDRKFDEIIGRQERTLSLMAQKYTEVGAVPSPTGQQQQQQFQPGVFPETIKRHEVDAVFNNQNQILNAIRDLRHALTEVKAKAENIIDNQAKQPTAQVQSVGFDTHSLVAEMRDSLHQVKNQFAQMNKPKDVACADVKCISLSSLLFIAVVQVLIIVGYNLYRDNRESQAKKFY